MVGKEVHKKETVLCCGAGTTLQRPSGNAKGD